MILRQDYIIKEMLEEALSTNIFVDKVIIDSNSKVGPKVPGMKYRHYAPKGELAIVEGSSEAVIEAVNQ